jgi:hypothetical protein
MVTALLPRGKTRIIAVSLNLIRQPYPRLGHVEKSHPPTQFQGVLGKLGAIHGIQPLARGNFTERHPPSPYVFRHTPKSEPALLFPAHLTSVLDPNRNSVTI